MLTVNKYRDVLLEEFYLDSNDITIRRNKDGWRGKFMKHDVVKPFNMVNKEAGKYGGIHVPRTRATVQHSHLLCLLRGIEIPEGYGVDHIDGNPENNLRSNLRVVTQVVNCKNAKMKVNNKTGYTGISFNKQANLYYIRKYFNGVRIYKSAKTLDEAVQILKEMETELISSHGYTKRHGKKGATTIPSGSTLQAIGSGSAQHPNRMMI